MLEGDLLKKEGSLQSSQLTIVDPATARLIMGDSPKRRLLLSMVQAARTVSEIAASEGMTVGGAHYLLTDFVRRGLAHVERIQKRGGRPIKHYRASARSFFVPIEHVSGSPGAGLTAELRACLDDALSRTDDDGVLFYVDEDGDPRVSWFGDRRRTQPVAEFWQILRLRDADALELVGDMERLLRRYQDRSGDGRVFLIHAAVAPRASR